MNQKLIKLNIVSQKQGFLLLTLRTLWSVVFNLVWFRYLISFLFVEKRPCKYDCNSYGNKIGIFCTYILMAANVNLIIRTYLMFPCIGLDRLLSTVVYNLEIWLKFYTFVYTIT